MLTQINTINSNKNVHYDKVTSNTPSFMGITHPKNTSFAPLKSDSLELKFTGWSPSKDPDWKELQHLAKLVNFTQDNELKAQLLQKEKTILDQELKNPAKYLDRVMNTGGMDLINDIPDDYSTKLTQIQINSLHGLDTFFIGFENLMGYDTKVDYKFYYPLLEKFIKKVSDTSPLAETLKAKSLNLLNTIYPAMDENYRHKAQKLAFYVLKNSPYEQCKINALNLFAPIVKKDNPIVEEVQNLFYQKLIGNNTPANDRHQALITLGKLRSPLVNNIIQDILVDNFPDNDLKLKTIAVWCAGKIKSEENFKLLLPIAKSFHKKDNENLSEEQIKFAEMVLSSVFEYKYKYPKIVEKFINATAEKDSPLKMMANALVENFKRKPKIKDFYIEKEMPSLIEQEDYKKLRQQYVKGLELLDTEQLNYLDMALLPVRKFLMLLCSTKSRIVIVDDLITSKKKDLTGTRIGDGRFWDMEMGLENEQEKLSIVHISSVKNNEYQTVGHELAHSILDLVIKLDPNEYKTLKKIFNKAKTENRCLCDYAKLNIDEYWAEGYQTYLYLFKPHEDLIDFDDKENTTSYTRSDLKRKDPELYEFIEHIIVKYGINESNVKNAISTYRPK